MVWTWEKRVPAELHFFWYANESTFRSTLGEEKNMNQQYFDDRSDNREICVHHYDH